MWGSDYPHDEGTHPYTREHLRARFSDVDPAEVRKILVGERRQALRLRPRRAGPAGRQVRADGRRGRHADRRRSPTRPSSACPATWTRRPSSERRRTGAIDQGVHRPHHRPRRRGSTELVLVDDPAPHVRRLTLNRPEKRNALNHPLRGQLIDALQRGRRRRRRAGARSSAAPARASRPATTSAAATRAHDVPPLHRRPARASGPATSPRRGWASGTWPSR